MLPMTLGDPQLPKTTIISTFYITFHTFIVGEWKDFKFGGKVDYILSPSLCMINHP